MWEFITNTFIPPPIIWAIAILWLLPIARWLEAKLDYWKIKSYLSIIWSMTIIASIGWEYYIVEKYGEKHFYPVKNNDYRAIEFIETTTNLSLLFIITSVFLIVTIYSLKYLRWETLLDDEGTYKLYYYFLLYSSLIGAMIVILTNDIFTLFVGWEFMVLPGYALVALRPRAKATEAGIKYAIQSSIGSIFLLYGITTVYEIAGTFNLTLINKALTQRNMASETITWIAISFILIGIGVTAGFIGMQTWIPDAYGEAPSSVGAFVSGTFALTSVVAIYKLIIETFHPATYNYAALLLWGGILSMTVGNLGAIKQKDIRRFLGYSSIAQRGYLLFGLGIVAHMTTQTQEIIKAVYAQGIAYAILEGGLFLAVGNLLYLYFPPFATRSLKILKGCAKNHTTTAFTIVICSLGLAGIPPTFGFVSKLMLVIAAGLSAIPVTALIIFALNSAISIIYYARYINNLVFTAPSEEIKKVKEKIPFSMNLSLAIIIIVSLILTIKPQIWLQNI